MVYQVIMIGLIGVLARWDDMLGCFFLNRPFVMGTLAGLVLGDLPQGIILGMTLELLMIGTFPVGAAVPPDYTNAGLLGTAFAISIGQGTEVAVALAYPLALLFGFVMNFLLVFEVPFIVRIADRFAEEGNVKAVARTNILGHLLWSVLFGICTAACFALGSTVMGQIVEAIPDVIMNGMTVAASMLPALGFALLARMIINKKIAPFFFLGFLLAAYLGIPTIGVTLLAVVIVLIILGVQHSAEGEKTVVAGGDEDDF